MKLISFFLAFAANSTFASPLDWRLKQADVSNHGDVLWVETTLEIVWDGDSPLEFTTYGEDVIHIGFQVHDDKGVPLEEVLKTGPAAAFQRVAVLKRGEARIFYVSAGAFVPNQSSTYTAIGRLMGESPRGKEVIFDLPPLTFTVKTPPKERVD